MMRLLFICNQGANRSRTAAELFSPQFETRYKGIYGNVVTGEDLRWADKVIAMEDHQRAAIAQQFPKEYLRAHIVTLDVPDIYQYNQPELRSLLKQRMSEVVPSTHQSSAGRLSET